MNDVAKLESMRALCEDSEAQDLLHQLWEGLIHPLEYSRHIIILASKYNLTLED